MVSAYGGIRWDTGLSRLIQYEHTQSELGATAGISSKDILKNSPIYNIDKINTPLLIMHNDKDGHVAGIRVLSFLKFRRLSKPSWLLNCNDARHWPLKMKNERILYQNATVL